MNLSVLHRTAFYYSSPVVDSVNTLHLQPRMFPYQKTLSALIRVIPATRLQVFTDLYQNVTHHFELPNPHSKLEIESRIHVETRPLDIPDEARNVGMAGYDEESLRERIWPYLQDSRRVWKVPSIWRKTVEVVEGCESVFAMAEAIMAWIHADFTYELGATGVKADLEESFEIRKGVCQDFTHVMLGMCRSIGLPARYASGYLYNGRLGSLVGAQSSHAWCEVYLPGGGWIGFDPTNNNLADERYVKVAVGRDYEDVAPVEGSYVGAGQCLMDIKVEVRRN
ncbi:MAG: transglutaminase family protein [Verrucomicrobiota bacterium JB025]|nr:transglutaminase family protein [Verrucomicrobiota bacterium JB025]